MRGRIQVQVLLAILFAVGQAQAWGRAELEVRVRLVEAPSVTLKGQLRYEGRDVRGSGHHLRVETGDGALWIDGRKARSPVSVVAEQGFVSLASRQYRGRIDLSVVRDKVRVVNSVPLESYLASVLGAEMGPNWPAEALMAQAVVARSYVWARRQASRGRDYDVDASVTSQVYTGLSGEHAATREAVAATEGKVLMYEGRVVEAYFHSTCGGQTEDAHAIWGRNLPYLTPVKDPYCENAPDYFWVYRIEPAELGRKLGLQPVIEVLITRRAPGGRVIELAIEDRAKRIRRLRGDDLRRMLGYNRLKSTLFRVAVERGAFVFKGSGAGHGIGLCQWGARAQAEQGRSYRQILKFYFPQADLDTL